MGFYINSHCKVRICTLIDESHSQSIDPSPAPHMKSLLLGLRAFTNTTPQLAVFEAAGCCHGAEAYISLRHR